MQGRSGGGRDPRRGGGSAGSRGSDSGGGSAGRSGSGSGRAGRSGSGGSGSGRSGSGARGGGVERPQRERQPGPTPPSGRGARAPDDIDRVVPGLHPVRELLRSLLRPSPQAPRVRALHLASERTSGPTLDEIVRLANQAGVVIRESDRERLDALAGGVDHQGVVAVASPFRYRELEDLLAEIDRAEPPLFVALDSVTDPHNLGSVARTAEAVGAHALIIPLRRAAAVGPAAEKAAAGAFSHLPVARVTNLARALRQLGEHRVWSVGLDAGAPTSLHRCELLAEPVILVVGSEGRGLSRLVAETCDVLVALPMRGAIGSLNASVAAAVALYEARRRRDAASEGAPSEVRIPKDVR